MQLASLMVTPPPRVCDWWYNVDCAGSPNSYSVNEDLYKIPEGRSFGDEALVDA